MARAQNCASVICEFGMMHGFVITNDVGVVAGLAGLRLVAGLPRFIAFPHLSVEKKGGA